MHFWVKYLVEKQAASTALRLPLHTGRAAAKARRAQHRLCYFCSAQGKEPQLTGSLLSQSWDVN